MAGYQLIVEGILAILLLAFLYYAVMLHRRLGSMRDSKGELEKLINTFADATGRADKSIQGFKATAEQSGRSLQETIDRAQSLRDDLAFLIEKAEQMADRTESSLRQQRSAAPAGKPTAPRSEAAGKQQRPRPPASPETRQGNTPPGGQPVSEIAPGAEDGDSRVQSKAEQELLKALQSMR